MMSPRSFVTLWTVLIAFNAFLLASEDALSQSEKPPKFSIAIHGGAGLEPDKLSVDDRREHEKALKIAVTTGAKILQEGGTALDAVEQAIRVLEDQPLYNAGKGAVFNNIGKHELDAAIVDGKTHTAGAVAGVTTIKNPISLARLVMTETPHVLLIGDGAERFADEMRGKSQIERVPNEYFSTEHRRREWQDAVAKEKAQPSEAILKGGPKPGKGTVGCVALDQHGNLVAGTSTGGLTNKKWGRVGSVPIVGAGTFADNSTCAVSGTGIGEHFILNSVGFQIHALMKFRGMTLEDAVTELTDRVMPNDTAGIIAVDREGRIVMRCNTPGMARASTDSSGKVTILLERAPVPSP